MGSTGVNTFVPMPKHVYHGPEGGTCGVRWYGTACEAKRLDVIHWMVCSLCGHEIHPRRVNTLESNPGFYHPGCASKAATFAQERAAIDVGSNWIGRLADARDGEQLLRDIERRPSRGLGRLDE